MWTKSEGREEKIHKTTTSSWAMRDGPHNYHNKIHIKLDELEWVVKQKRGEWMCGIVSGELCMMMMLLNVSTRVRGGSKRFNTCKSDGLTPDCVCAELCLFVHFILRAKVKSLWILLCCNRIRYSLVFDKQKKEAPKDRNRTFIYPRAHRQTTI